MPPPWSSAALEKRSTHHYAQAVEKQSFNGEYTADSVIVTLSVALALYSSLEMILLISTTFKSWRGLYFWSLSLCNLGVILYTIGMMMGYFDLGVKWLGKAIDDIGWVSMIAFQSLVLYSRLGLVLENPKILRAVKWMIISTSVGILPTVCILDFGSTYSNQTFTDAYYYIEHLQLVVITLQELIISGLYVWKTMSLLKIISKPGTRNVIWQLFTMNIVIMTMDVAIIVLQYEHYQLYQESIKAFVYAVKLKLELSILSKLVDLVHGSAQRNRSMTLDEIDATALSGQSQAEVRREMKGSQDFSSRSFASMDKSILQQNGEGNAIKPSLASIDKNISEQNGGTQDTQPRLDNALDGRLKDDDDDDGYRVAPVLSHQSRYSARTSGRESDMMYADMLRDLR